MITKCALTPEDRSTPQGYPQGRYYAGDEAMVWADVVLDCRANFRHDEPMLQQFPTPGTRTNSGTLVVSAEPGHADTHPTMGRVVVSWHALYDQDEPAWSVKVTYGDGWSAAYVQSEADYSSRMPDQQLANYRSDEPDGFVWFVGRAIDGDEREADAAYVRTIRPGLAAFRDAMSDPAAWLSSGDLAESTQAGPARDLVFWSSCGVTGYGAAQALSQALLSEMTVMDAVHAGFDLRDTATHDWVTAEVRGEWRSQHHDGWKELHCLFTEGWASGAMRALHRHTGLVWPVDRGRWNDDSNVVSWLALLGTPRAASAYIDAGVGFYEASRMVRGGNPADAATLTMLAALSTENA